MTDDPLLAPYRLRHLTRKNCPMSTAHEPACSEDGLPKARYRRYHPEKARGGIALTMTAGSAVVSPDSSPDFGNLHAWRDDIVPWLAEVVVGHGTEPFDERYHALEPRSTNRGEIDHGVLTDRREGTLSPMRGAGTGVPG